MIHANQAFADFDNGDRWIVVKASECSRGQACNIAYIDRTINYDLIQKIIMPTIKAFPYQAY